MHELWGSTRKALGACALFVGLVLAPAPAFAAGCDVAGLQKAIGKITEPLAPMTPAAAAKQATDKADDLEKLAARARGGALDDPDAANRIVCARLAVQANLALSFVDAKRASAARTLAEMSALGGDACDARQIASGPEATDCAFLRRQRKLSPARLAVEDLAALEPKPVNAATREMSAETWRSVGAIMRSLSRTVVDEWPEVDDERGVQKRAILCRLVSVATTRGVTSWRPWKTPSEDDRADSFDSYYSATLAAGAVQLGLKTPDCADPARPACALARSVAVQALCKPAAR